MAGTPTTSRDRRALSKISPLAIARQTESSKTLGSGRLLLDGQLLRAPASPPMLKVLRTTDSNIVFTLIGRLEAENMTDLRGLLAAEPAGSAVVLDLTDLVLVDREAVRFLRTCERDGIMVRNCPQYIRTWMECEEEG